MSGQKIIITGHFDIGETYSSTAQLLVENAKRSAGKKLVLVGDIGVEDKLFAYIRKGVDGVVLTYHIRHHCAQTECVLAQLPKTEAGIRAVIDVDQYTEMTTLLQREFPAVYHAIEKNENEALVKLKAVGTGMLTAKLVQQRLKQYGLNEDEVWLVREKALRNRAGRKIKTAWKALASFNPAADGIRLGNEYVTNATQKPVCRGIIFALNELIAEKGFTTIDYFIEDRHLLFMQKGWNLFDRCRAGLGEYGKTPQSVSFITEKDLCCKA
jgi:hypothetical protein